MINSINRKAVIFGVSTAAIIMVSVLIYVSSKPVKSDMNKVMKEGYSLDLQLGSANWGYLIDSRHESWTDVREQIIKDFNLSEVMAGDVVTFSCILYKNHVILVSEDRPFLFGSTYRKYEGKHDRLYEQLCRLARAEDGSIIKKDFDGRETGRYQDEVDFIDSLIREVEGAWK